MSENSVKWETMMEVASLSDIGMRRTSNQDSLCVWQAPTLGQWEDRGHLFVVADGMGAHAAGELASKIAVDHIPHLFVKHGNMSPSDALRRALQDANAEIHRRGQANDDFHNMGTTCSSLLLNPEGAWVGHVGDSRVYRLRGSILEQLTFDHSLVWEMRQQGSLEEAESSSGAKIPKNVITRSLGPYPEVRVDLEGPFDIQAGDVFMLCSDGLTGQIEDSELGALMQSLAPVDAVRVLVDLANLRGGPDNITLIVIRITSSQLASSGAPVNAVTAAGSSNGENKKARFVTPLLWALMAVLVLASAWLVVSDNLLIALVPAIISVGVLGILIVRRFSGEPEEQFVQGGEQLGGKGPYVRIDSRATAWKTVDHLRDMIQQIRNAGQQKNWKIDEQQLQLRLGRAESAAATRDVKNTLKEFSLTISFVMDQLRKQENAL